MDGDTAGSRDLFEPRNILEKIVWDKARLRAGAGAAGQSLCPAWVWPSPLGLSSATLWDHRA